MKIDEALYQLKQSIKMHEIDETTSNKNEREKALLDYITNLQEENKRLKDKLNIDLEWAKRCDELFEENNRLNNIIKELEKLIDSYELGKYDYEIPVVILKDKLKELKEGKE